MRELIYEAAARKRGVVYINIAGTLSRTRNAKGYSGTKRITVCPQLQNIDNSNWFQFRKSWKR